MIKELWNVGLKVTDLDREVAFLREVGASLVLRERVSMVGDEREYAIARRRDPALSSTDEGEPLRVRRDAQPPHFCALGS
jgi:hypothetical protein